MSAENLLPKKIQQQEKKYVSDRTRFKLCVYYSHKPCGTPYSVIEKNFKKHRKYHDSYDYVPIKGGKTVTREDMAFNKLLHHVEHYKAYIEFALLYVNNFSDGKQYLIGKFFKDEQRSQFVMPNFKEDSLGIGHCYFDGLQASPLEVSDIQQVILKKLTA